MQKKVKIRTTRMKTGQDKLDSEHPGLLKGEVGVVLGNEGSGKSRFLSQLAAHSLKQDLSVFYLSYKDGAQTILNRVYGSLTQTPVNYLKYNISVRDLQNIIPDARFSCHQAPKNQTVVDLADLTNSISGRMGKPVDLVIVDSWDHFSKQGKWFSHVKLLAEETDCAVWASYTTSENRKTLNTIPETKHAKFVIRIEGEKTVKNTNRVGYLVLRSNNKIPYKDLWV